MKNIITIFAIFTTFLFAESQIDLEKEIAIASAIENSVQRLAAYDAIAKKHELAPNSEVNTEIEGNWEITTSISPIDDSKTVICYLEAEESVKVGYDTIKPILIVRYKEGELTSFINYSVFLGSDSIPVTLRMGKGNPENATWGISTNHKSAFVSGDIGKFVNRLENVNSFIVRLTPYGESPVTVSFNPVGVGKIKEAIIKATK
jgi:type VI secretion system protein VasI